jgi:hypothetical protein
MVSREDTKLIKEDLVLTPTTTMRNLVMDMSTQLELGLTKGEINRPSTAEGLKIALKNSPERIIY